MSLLLETIRIEDRGVRNADFHNRRMNRARKELFGIASDLDVRNIISIPAGMGMGVFKCRILYDDSIRDVRILPHLPRVVDSLKLVYDDRIDYSYKYADRRRLEDLLSRKGDCDDILIVKNACISDTSFSNIVFQTGEGTWITPDTPLLNGTMRQFLLEEGRITERRTGVEDLGRFRQARLVNCMMDLDSGPVIGIPDIKD